MKFMNSTLKRTLFIFTLLLSVLNFSYAEASSEQRKKIITLAKSLEGKPYSYNGSRATGPDAFDCSGFVLYVSRNAIGKEIPRTSSQQFYSLSKISRAEILPGDLVFFSSNRVSINHVGIYLGDDKFISALSSGKRTGIQISSLSGSYWRPKIYGYAKLVSSSSLEKPKVPEPQKPIQNKNKETIAAKNQEPDSNGEEKKSYNWFCWNITGMVNWNVNLTGNNVLYSVPGGTGCIDLVFDKFIVKPAIGSGFTFNVSDSSVTIPARFSLGYGECLNFYGEACLIYQLGHPFDYGFRAGLQIGTPFIHIGKTDWQLVQDISTDFTRIDSASGIKVRLKK